MISIQIISVGKLKEKSLKTLTDEYIKRISKYAKLEIIELADEKIDGVSSFNEKENIKKIECDRIIKKINPKSFVFCLDLKGKTYTSEKLSEKIESIATYNTSSITFVIGGSLGLNDEIRNLSNELISFSTLTFPNQLIKLFLLEQIFRCFKISNNETYHH